MAMLIDISNISKMYVSVIYFMSSVFPLEMVLASIFRRNISFGATIWYAVASLFSHDNDLHMLKIVILKIIKSVLK